ncbi:MAG TPA: GNAT family N-acetyltransferase [Vitreimonas sp.]|uniref:GNAT family N-acetyltransferase n=1 Tax=Vitreimonas sp. TaxID=3069702 RepID=UPI002D40F25F|nr:GNAT family N-acetyltransferase [Vitreimonas sp.]HYD86193.1 GNAT family N-acetyltransferase [Vitreimonas sp.]
MTFTIATETPLSDDVRALVQALNAFTYDLTPAEYRHHMTVEQMAQPDTTLFVARDANGAPLGMGALRRHPNGAGEVKRMFVKPEARGLGLGGAILAHIEALAREEGLVRLVLETGANFDAAKRVYERGGLTPCEPVLDYPPSPWTAFYAKALTS